MFATTIFEEQGKSPERIYKWKETAESLKTAFVETFLNDYGYLYDYVDGNYMDLSVRQACLSPSVATSLLLTKAREKSA